MNIEIEKKFRLTKAQRERLPQLLKQIGAKRRSEDLEENTLYRGSGLEVGSRVLRLRRVNGQAILTFKERLPSDTPVKHQRENETRVDDPESLHLILEGLGFAPFLIYEKRRERWLLGNAEIVLDELPFGLFMEIEASEEEINDIEKRLEGEELAVENLTYPQLTMKHGTQNGEVVAARFAGESGA